MDKAYLPELIRLPRFIENNIDGTQVLFIHYQISKSKMSEPISKEPYSSIVEPSLENLQSLFKDRNDDVICFGHHHPLHYFKGKNRFS